MYTKWLARKLTWALRIPVTSAEPPDSGNATDHWERHRPFLEKKRDKK
jgi:hypothetical protein